MIAHKGLRALLCVLTLEPAFMWADEVKLLGEIEFPNSGAAEAQDDFIEGMLYMHNFEYDEAQAAFERARTTDPDFAMAYWGEAMTYHHALWGQQSRTTAEEILMRLGKTSEARAAKCGTQREKDFIRAAEILFGMTKESQSLPKAERDALYRDAMRAIHEKYPEDNEATSLYGLSILGAAYGNRDYGTYMRAAAVLTQVWDANRMHPGAAHYLIHSYDDPVHAPLGLPMARAYSKIAPAAAHAQHMTSHIFVAMGMWDDLVKANETAVEIEFKNADGLPEASMEASHYVYWLQYGYLQQGRYADAKELLRMAREKLDNNPTSRAKTYYGAMYARYLFDTRDSEGVAAFVAPDDSDIASPHYHFARAMDAAAAGDIDTARERAKHVQAVKDGNPEVTLDDSVVGVLKKELEGIIKNKEGKTDEAVASFTEAAANSKDLPIRYGPPQVTKPAHEMLGEMLIAAGKPDEAVEAFEYQLEQTPLRAQSLIGLAEAAEDAGDETKEADAYRRLAAIWHSADPGIEGYEQAMKSVKQGS